LLVFTDGNFSALPGELDQTFSRLKERFQGRSLQVYFVSLPGEELDTDLRSALLATFNGAPDAGATTITRADQVFPGLRDVVTELAGGDPARDERFVRRDGEEVSFKLPFSVRRLVVLSTGSPDAPPAGVISTSFPLTTEPALVLEPSMKQPDPNDPFSLRARVTHLTPAQPLASGKEYRLALDRPMGPDDRILFDSDLKLQIEVKDAQGRAPRRGADRRLRIIPGQTLRVSARFLDLVDGRWRALDLAGSGVEAEVTLNDGLRSTPMQPEAGTPDFIADGGPYPDVGQFTLRVIGRIAGLKYVRSEDLLIEVVPIQSVHPRLSGRYRYRCPGCDPSRVELAYAPGEDDSEPYEIEAAAPDAPGPADYRLELTDPLPDGVLIVDGDGSLVFDRPGETRLQIAPGEPAVFRLRYDEGYRTDRPSRLRLTLTDDDPALDGEARLDLQLVPIVAPLTLRPDGHTLEDPLAPFSLPVTRVGQGDGIYIRADGLRTPLREADLELHNESRLPMQLSLVGDDRLMLLPKRKYWCDCLTPSGEHAFGLTYRNPDTRQSADYQGSLAIASVPWWGRCKIEIGLLLLLVLAVLKVLCVLRTSRFPVHGRAYRFVTDRELPPDRLDLHRPFSAFFSCWSERRTAFGLRLAAHQRGAWILAESAIPPGLYDATTAESVAEMLEQRGRKPVFWRFEDELRDRETGDRYLLVRDHNRFDEEDFRRRRR